MSFSHEVPDPVLEMIAERFPGQPLSRFPVTHHVVVRVGQDTVVKSGNEEGWDIDIEADLLTRSGISCEKALCAGRPALIMEFLGPPLSDSDYGRRLPEVAEALRGIHRRDGLSLPGLPEMVKGVVTDRALSRLNETYPEHAQRWFRSAASMLPELPGSGSTVVHTDPHPGNWIDQGERLVLIDWENAHLGHPETDLAAVIIACHMRGLDHGPVLDTYPEYDSGRLTTLLAAKLLGLVDHLTWSQGGESFDTHFDTLVAPLVRAWDLPLPTGRM